MNNDHLRTIGPDCTPFCKSVMAQSFSALYWFERFFQEVGAAAVMELGTGNGTLTQFFGLHCPGHVRTYDIGAASITDKHRAEIFARLGITYEQKDLLVIGAISNLLVTYEGRRPLLVFCDNGNKKQEFLEAAPLLRPGDSIMVHDVNVEFIPSGLAIATAIETFGLMPWKHNQAALEDGSRLSCWLKR